MRFASPDHERRQVVAEIRAAFPLAALCYGIDRKGCYARIGEVEGWATDCAAALRVALAQAREAPGQTPTLKRTVDDDSSSRCHPGSDDSSLRSDASVGAEGSAVWRCFHCDEVFADRQCAQDHFGLDECETPGCVAILTEGERAILEDRRMWRERAFQEERDHEQTATDLSHLRWDVREIIRREAKRQNVALTDNARELKWVWETMEGQMLAADAALNAAPRWLASWLRRRAERVAIAKATGR